MGAGLGSALGGRLGGDPGSFGNTLATATASGIANAATRSAINGNSFGDNLIAAIPDIIGQAVGSALGRAVYDPARAAQKAITRDIVAGRSATVGDSVADVIANASVSLPNPDASFLRPASETAIIDELDEVVIHDMDTPSLTTVDAEEWQNWTAEEWSQNLENAHEYYAVNGQFNDTFKVLWRLRTGEYQARIDAGLNTMDDLNPVNLFPSEWLGDIPIIEKSAASYAAIATVLFDGPGAKAGFPDLPYWSVFTSAVDSQAWIPDAAKKWIKDDLQYGAAKLAFGLYQGRDMVGPTPQSKLAELGYPAPRGDGLHAHHTLSRNGQRGVVRERIREAQAILKRFEIDYRNGPENLTLAPHIGNHTPAKDLAVAKDIISRSAEPFANRETFVRVLQTHAKYAGGINPTELYR